MKFIGTFSLLLALDQARFTDGKPVGSGVKGHQIKRKGQVKLFDIGNLDPETGFQNCETEITIQMFEDLPIQRFKSADCDGTTGRRNLKKGSDKKKKGKGKKKESKEDMGGTDGGLTLAMRREESGHIAASINDYENKILYHISGKEGEENGLIVKETPLEYVLEEKDARDVSDEDDNIDIIRALSEGSTTANRLGGPTAKRNEQRGQDLFAASSSRNLAVDDLGGNIDVMVVWTKTAECENYYDSDTECTNVDDDTYASMLALVNLAIQETNDAFIGSGIPSQLRLVHAFRHETYLEYGTSPSDNALDDITDGVQGLGDVHELRETVGADMVHFLVHVNDYCGIAWRPSSPRYDLAYAVTDWSCATGGYTFGHELGHNFSCNHDRGTKQVCNSNLSAYNYGYRHPQGDFRSMLSYNCDRDDCDTNDDGCMRVPRYSNQYEQWNGQDIGSSIADCAQTITDYLPTVAAFTTAIPDAPTISPGPTPSPTTPGPTPELSLDFIGDAFGFQAYGECQGDCDSDTDCQFGLNCKQRNGIEDVPGCGGSDSFSTWDFCYVPPPGELVYVADNNLPDNFLKECQGDCDGDGDCEWGTLCMQRGSDFPSDAPVPGCTGDGLDGYDYCWKPPAGTLVEYGNDDDRTNFPLQECWGDCDNDEDCAGNFECFQRDGTEPVDGCTGQGRSGLDYCYCPPGVTCNVGPTPNPTLSPTPNPTSQPTNGPTSNPTPQPTPMPVQPTDQPTNGPTKNPTPEPTPMPVQPTDQPTNGPTKNPTPEPTPAPVQPTPNPTPQPTPNPTPQPTQGQPTCCNCGFFNWCLEWCC